MTSRVLGTPEESNESEEVRNQLQLRIAKTQTIWGITLVGLLKRASLFLQCLALFGVQGSVVRHRCRERVDRDRRVAYDI